VYADMQFVQSVYHGSKDFVNFLNSPIIHLDKKQAVIKAVFGNSISDISLGFFKILTDKRREMYLGDIAKAFIEQYKEHKHITTAIVTSAAGIDAGAREKILNLVKAQVKGEVELVEKVDKDLIGGFVLRIGDKQVDASISRKLNELRKSFSENPHTININ
jgi:F-type H+-transporting ATPase subunit delta